jgi:tetratricopeptide (TPR) repeat protein
MRAKINSLTILIIGIFIAQCAFSQKSNIDSLARIYYENYQFQKVIDLLHSDSLNYKQNEIKAKSHEKIGDVDKAIVHYQKALRTNPQDKQLIFSLAKCYEKSANYPLAIVQLNNLIKIDSSNSYFHRELANLYLKNQQFILSIASFTKARELNKNDIESGVALVNLYLKLALNEKAMEIAKSLISKETKNKAVLTAHLKAAYRNKDYKSAI